MPGSCLADRFRRCEEGVCGGYYLVPRADSDGPQTEPEGIRAASRPHSAAASAVGSKLLLELLDENASCKGAGVQNSQNGKLNLFFDRVVLCFQIEKRYGFH